MEKIKVLRITLNGADPGARAPIGASGIYISIILSVSLAQPILQDLPNLGWFPILSKISISAEARLLLHSLKCVCVCVCVCLCVCLGKDKLTKPKSWISQQLLIGSSSNFKLKLRGPNQNQKCLKWRRPQNVKSWISRQLLIGSSSTFELKLMGPKWNKMNMTSYGRRPQDIKSWISLQSLIGSSTNFKL